jgi:cytochrome b561
MKSNRPYTLAHRLLHWALAFAMIFMLITILLRMGWMNKNHVAGIILGNLDPDRYPLSEQEAVTLAKKIRKPMWQWHIYTGYAITAIYLLRLLHMWVSGRRFLLPWRTGLSVAERVQGWAYVVFYALLAYSLVTGYLVEFGPASIHETMEDLHAIGIWYLGGFMVLHLAGIVWQEVTKTPGIVSRMIGGDRSSS